MDVSRFVIERLTVPAGETAATLDRIERLLTILFEIEKERMARNREADVWVRLVQRADARLEEERLLQ